jgi:hypothetical protein
MRDLARRAVRAPRPATKVSRNRREGMALAVSSLILGQPAIAKLWDFRPIVIRKWDETTDTDS